MIDPYGDRARFVGFTNIAGTYLRGRAGEIMPKRVALTLIYLRRGIVFLGLLYLPLTERRSSSWR